MRQFEIPPLWLMLFLALAWGIWRLVPVHVFGAGGHWAGRGAGGLLIALGLALMLAAVIQMVRGRTTFIPRRDPSTLITTGVFRFSRNPIYLGDALVLTGAALWWDAPLALLLVPLFMGVIQWRFIAGEEARLAAEFGPAFSRWASQTRRWL